jgi:hypothetical protein
MIRVRDTVSAAALVLFPLCILAYWVLYPAYGLLEPDAIVRAINGHARLTTIANACALLGVLLTVPATLGMMRVLNDRSPMLSLIGGGLSLVGWIALIGALTPDILAVQMADHELTPALVELFRRFSLSPTMITINIVVALHLVGGILLGIALLRTRVVPRWAGVVATIMPPIHLTANVTGRLVLDALTWIALAAAYSCVARVILRPDATQVAIPAPGLTPDAA